MKNTKETPNKKPNTPDVKQQTAVYLPESIRARLGRYMLDKHAGRLNVRNQVILAAIEEKLAKEGY